MTKKGKAQWNKKCTWRARYRASHKTLQSLKVCILLVWWHSATLECISAQWNWKKTYLQEYCVKRHFELCICLWNFVFVFVVIKMTKTAASERAYSPMHNIMISPLGSKWSLGTNENKDRAQYLQVLKPKTSKHSDCTYSRIWQCQINWIQIL